MDRVLRLWNPYVPGKPTGFLKGHSSPIFYLCISSEDNCIFSVSMDNNAKIWDIQDQSCLFTAHPKASLVRGHISACLYSPSTKGLYIASDSLALLSLKTRPQPQGHLTVSHKEPVMCCGYSREFRQVVSCSEGSVIKVWDFDTGSQVFEFGGAHGQSAITCMTFDPKGKRLVTGGRDGSLKIWNFNNGQCLKTLRKEERHHLQKPQPPWQDDLRMGHKDDILCVAQCPPSLLATGSYDGEVIVWNLASGHILCRFTNPLPTDFCNNCCQIHLFVSYPFMLSRDFGFCDCGNFKQQITKFAVTKEDTSLYAADQLGYVYVYHVKTYALGSERTPPTGRILLLTSSIDCTVRLWSAYGEFIGTFGQQDIWSIHTPSSWKHPAVPYEILIDPLSMPFHPILQGKTSMSDTVARQVQAQSTPCEKIEKKIYWLKIELSIFHISDSDMKYSSKPTRHPIMADPRHTTVSSTLKSSTPRPPARDLIFPWLASILSYPAF
uniref:WD40 repeat domain 95 n=1 Tax=Esox lucius TaxID=8010 RepID=A0A3P8XSW6_ESOLU